MKVHVLTPFPEIIEGYFKSSIMAKAVEKGIVEYSVINIRDFAFDRHKTCDDYSYGGGAGMILKPEPLAGCCCDTGGDDYRVHACLFERCAWRESGKNG